MTSARANSRSRCCPPDSSLAVCSAYRSSPTNASSSSARREAAARSSSLRCSSGMKRFCSAVSVLNTRAVWKVRLSPSAARSHERLPPIVRPASRTSPSSAETHAVDDVEQRGLARAVRADQTRDGVGVDKERHLVEGRDTAETLADGVDGEQRLRAAAVMECGAPAPRSGIPSARPPRSCPSGTEGGSGCTPAFRPPGT